MVMVAMFTQFLTFKYSKGNGMKMIFMGMQDSLVHRVTAISVNGFTVKNKEMELTSLLTEMFTMEGLLTIFFKGRVLIFVNKAMSNWWDNGTVANLLIAPINLT